MDKTTVRAESRAARHLARRVLWEESSIPRVKRCARNVASSGAGVAVKVTGAGSDRRAGFAGVAVCGSTWACPCCSAKIAAGRADDLAAAFGAWRARGGSVAMLTLTMRHRAGQGLATLWDSQAYAWRKVLSGRAWVRDQAAYGIAGWVRVVEVTHGVNGWHVHVHAALFLHADVDAASLQLLGDSIHGRWARALERRGLAAPWRDFTNLKTLHGDTGTLGSYFTKNVYEPRSESWELVGGQGKTARGTNRTPFQILADVVALGDADDLALWHEWESVSHGRRQLTWSKGMRAALDLLAEVDDQALAEADDLNGDVLLILRDWKAARWHQALILDLAESDDTGAKLRKWLDGAGILYET